MVKAKKRMGRPPGVTHPNTLQMRVSDEFLKLIDDWRRKQPKILPRTEAVRRLVELGVKASKAG
jgi:hypothetical protein